MMQEALVKRLLASNAIAAQLGNRITWVSRPDRDSLPALVLVLVNDPEEETHDSLDNLQYSRIQFSCWGESFGSTQLLKRVVSSEMHQVNTTDDVLFEEAIKLSGISMPMEQLDSGTKLFHYAMDFMVPYRPVA